MLRRSFFDLFGVATGLALVTRLEPELFDGASSSEATAPPDRLRPPPRGPIRVAVFCRTALR